MAKDAGARLAWRTAWVALLASLPLAIVGWAVSASTVTWLFGDSFAGVPDVLGVLLLGVVPYSFARVLSNYLAGINKVGLNASASAIILVISVTLALQLIPEYGAIGAAWATAISYGLHTFLIGVLFLRVTHGPDFAARDSTTAGQ